MASHVVSLTSFFLLIFCMHFSNARLLLLQVSEKKSQIGSPVTPSPSGEYDKLNGQDIRKIDRVFKEGSEIVESSSSHHVALLKGKHFKVNRQLIYNKYKFLIKLFIEYIHPNIGNHTI
ncbi:hypothetical protein HanPSC8_Chr14g0641741 [Helianthus annuus]|nr:hypothetical protein HanPSC8_Chr14g0641741 [Helianthus annuus]